MQKERTDRNHGAVPLKITWALAAIWLVATLLPLIWPGAPGAATLASLNFFVLTLIAALQLWLLYGWSGLGTFVVIVGAVSFLCEASSIATGFPYGYYTHDLPGFKPFGVPIRIPFSYISTGWFAWALARIIVRDDPASVGGRFFRFVTPIIATFILAGVDFPRDAIFATVRKAFTYRYPSGQFGVPLTNFLGWLFMGWVFYQLFALVEDRFHARAVTNTRSFWLLPCLIWLANALPLPFMWAAAPAGTVDRGGRTFVIADVYEAAVAASLFTMVFASLLALVRLYSRHQAPLIRSTEPRREAVRAQVVSG